jgi:hypothetical protein
MKVTTSTMKHCFLIYIYIYITHVQCISVIEGNIRWFWDGTERVIIILLYFDQCTRSWLKGRRGHDRLVVGFTTTYAISACHHWWCEFEPRSGRGVQHYVIKFVSDLWQVGGFLRVLRFPSPIKLTATI